MIKNLIKTYWKNYRNLISNFGYLSILQSVNLLIPITTYPYLIRVLGANLYGQIVFAQSVISFFSIIINFGFEISGVKNVAEHQDNKEKLSEIVSSVITIKLFIFILSFIGLFLFFLFTPPSFKENTLLYLLTFGICIGDVFFPAWFFQGIEKMKYTTIINIVIRCFFMVCIFIFVHKSSDYLLVPLLNSLGAVLGAFSSILILLCIEKIKLKLPSGKQLRFYFKESLPFFTSRVSAVILAEANTLIIGTFINMKSVAFYDLAKKIVNVFLIPNSIINTVIYPHIVKTKSNLIVSKVLKFRIVIALMLYFVVFFFSKYFILLLGGEDMLPSLPIIRLFGLYLILTSISFFLGGTVLVSFNKSKYFNLSVIYSLIIFLLIFGALYITNIINIYSVIILTLSTEGIIAAYRYYYCRKFNLIF